MTDLSGGGGGSSRGGYGWMDQTDAASEFNRVAFHVRMLMSRIRTLTPVKVTKVLKQDGKTKAVQGEVSKSGSGFVEVQPLISMVDGNGRKQDHGIIYNVPYHRVHGGASSAGPNALVIDPAVGDIGFMHCFDRDTHSFKKKTVQQNSQNGGGSSSTDSSSQGSGGNQAGQGSGQTSLPGSGAMHDLAHGMYCGALLTKAPKQYMTYTATGSQWAGGPKQQQGGGQQKPDVNTITLDNSKQNSGSDPSLLKSQEGKTDTGVAGFLAQTFHGHKHGMGQIMSGGQQIIDGILHALGAKGTMKFDASVVGSLMSHIADAGHTMQVVNGNFTHTVSNGTHTETAQSIVHNGNQNNTGNLVQNGTGLFNLNLTSLQSMFGNAFNITSDKRIKTKNKPLRNILKSVLGIQVKSYLLNGTTKSIGIHAQDLQPLFPELVVEHPNSDMLYIQESKIGVLAVAALQEMHAEVVALRKRVATLEGR